MQTVSTNKTTRKQIVSLYLEPEQVRGLRRLRKEKSVNTAEHIRKLVDQLLRREGYATFARTKAA